YSFSVCDAFFYKTEIRIIHDRSQGREISRIGQAVQAYDPVVGIFVQHMKNKVASNESGSAGNDNSHNLSPYSLIIFSEGCPDIFRPEHLLSTGRTDFSSALHRLS